MTELAVRIRGLDRLRRLPTLTARVVEDEYTKFMLRRFDQFSAGGGDWPNTLTGPPILFKKGDLRKGLARGVILRGDKVYLRTNARHPRAKMTIKRLVGIHHFGNRHLPSRKVMVPPDSLTKRMIQRRLFRD